MQKPKQMLGTWMIHCLLRPAYFFLLANAPLFRECHEKLAVMFQEEKRMDLGRSYNPFLDGGNSSEDLNVQQRSPHSPESTHKLSPPSAERRVRFSPHVTPVRRRAGDDVFEQDEDDEDTSPRALIDRRRVGRGNR